ncbi:MAG TPA: thioesterase family protein [Micromonosporaceae bacterium]|jgi:acyl-CoA thioester hydrolase
MRFTYECPVRWSDLDLFGHVNNARVLTLFEEARVALMFVGAREAGLTSFEKQGIVIHRHEIDYVRPIDYGPRVRVEMWVSDLRASRFTVSYELYADDLLACRAASVCVPFDLAAQRPRRLSEPERDFLKPWLE